MAVSPRGQRFRTALFTWYPIDAAVWVSAVVVAQWARYDFSTHRFDLGFTLLMPLAPIALLIAGLTLGVYLGRYVAASFEEAAALASTSVVAGALLTLVATVLSTGISRSVPVLATAFAIVGMWAARFVLRSLAARTRRGRQGTRVLIFGAGRTAQRLLRTFHDQEDGRFLPVALLDDDPTKSSLRIAGVPVAGTREAIAAAAQRYEATTMIVALPSADSALIRDLTTRAEAAGLRVLILPAIDKSLRRAAGAEDLREINVHDLLGRQPVSLDEAAISSQIMGKRVLVTGAGGSIGAELCRQLHRFAPAELVMLDRDESALHAVQLSIEGRALLDSEQVVLADIRDEVALHRIFAERRPQIVFHAAALKHLPLLERYPMEAWKSNVVGTHQVLQAAASVDVEMFVNISTDKAADPTSVLGFSKRIAERLTAAMAWHCQGTYVSVRFGNVLGSRGSVLTAFEKQIREGGPLTVTHPEVTRYFMTISEACQLVLQSSCIGTDGEVMILEMGEPVKILDVASTLIEQSGNPDIEVIFTGLREGEKLHEELFSERETHRRGAHPAIFHAEVAPLVLDHDGHEMRRFATHREAFDYMREAALLGTEVTTLPLQFSSHDAPGQAPEHPATLLAGDTRN